jgi:hypothetical protein
MAWDERGVILASVLTSGQTAGSSQSAWETGFIRVSGAVRWNTG